MKTTFKVLVYGEIVFSGTMDAAIKIAIKENRKANSNVAQIEVWNKEEDYYLACIPEFWSW